MCLTEEKKNENVKFFLIFEQTTEEKKLQMLKRLFEEVKMTKSLLKERKKMAHSKNVEIYQ